MARHFRLPLVLINIAEFCQSRFIVLDYMSGFAAEVLLADSGISSYRES
jgi:hypothetical protein